MASPLSLLLFGVIAGVLAENEHSNSYPFNNGAVLPDAIKKPLSPYLNDINIETNFHEELAELSKINPVLSGVMEELHENIIAMESVLKAKYLFFGEIMEIFKKKKDIIGSDDPASILGKALYSVPAERREILVDFLSSNEHLGYGTAF
uniref:P4Ha_N domain-containing protein n=1 Tax=Haemonchus contortus TaxID=6289 RepID=W6NPK8_HAECO